MANNKQIGLLFGVDNTGLDKGSGKTIADQLKTISDEINKKGEYTQIKFSVDTQATTKQIQDQLNQIAKGLTIKIGGFDQSTIDANARFFASMDEVPKEAYTMGIKTIMQAKKIVVVVNGAQKADIVKKAFFGPITPEVPASILQLHNDVTVVGDEAALSAL